MKVQTGLYMGYVEAYLKSKGYKHQHGKYYKGAKSFQVNSVGTTTVVHYENKLGYSRLTFHDYLAEAEIDKMLERVV